MGYKMRKKTTTGNVNTIESDLKVTSATTNALQTTTDEVQRVLQSTGRVDVLQESVGVFKCQMKIPRPCGLQLRRNNIRSSPSPASPSPGSFAISTTLPGHYLNSISGRGSYTYPAG